LRWSIRSRLNKRLRWFLEIVRREGEDGGGDSLVGFAGNSIVRVDSSFSVSASKSSDDGDDEDKNTDGCWGDNDETESLVTVTFLVVPGSAPVPSESNADATRESGLSCSSPVAWLFSCMLAVSFSTNQGG
jgi:hypothetical protein